MIQKYTHYDHGLRRKHNVQTVAALAPVIVMINERLIPINSGLYTCACEKLQIFM